MMDNTASNQHDIELAERMYISADQIGAYRQEGFVRLREVLSAQLLVDYREEITRVVRSWTIESFVSQVQHDCGDAIAEGLLRIFESVDKTGKRSRQPSTYELAFTQRMNLWRHSDVISRLVRSKRLARLAADLMGVEGVRLYHDQALYKEAHGGHTPWHADQFYWPLSSDHTITVWIPLQAVGLDMGPVCFAPASHLAVKELASQLSISDESERILGEKMSTYDVEELAFDIGEVSFHSGWTCHRAGPNKTADLRAVFTIIYMDKDIRMIEPQHRNHVADAGMWLPGIQPGEIAASTIKTVL